METKTLRRYRRCAGCDNAATENTDLCAECLADEEWRAKYEAPALPNSETCATCGAELSRNGHCLRECTLDGWSPAQVLEVSA